MIIFGKYLKNAFISSFVSTILILTLSQVGFLTSFHFKNNMTAFLLTTSNYLLGIFLLENGIKRKDSHFLIIVLGGMVFRLLLMLLLIFICMNLLILSFNYFIFTTFILYNYYLILEIVYLARK